MKTNFENLFQVTTASMKAQYEESLKQHQIIKDRYQKTLEKFIFKEIAHLDDEVYEKEFIYSWRMEKESFQANPQYYIDPIDLNLNIINFHIKDIEDGEIVDIDPVVDLKEFL